MREYEIFRESTDIGRVLVARQRHHGTIDWYIAQLLDYYPELGCDCYNVWKLDGPGFAWSGNRRLSPNEHLFIFIILFITMH